MSIYLSLAIERTLCFDDLYIFETRSFSEKIYGEKILYQNMVHLLKSTINSIHTIGLNLHKPDMNVNQAHKKVSIEVRKKSILKGADT